MSDQMQPSSLDAWLADKLIKISEGLAELTALGKASDLRDSGLDARLVIIEEKIAKREADEAEHRKKLEDENRGFKRGALMEVLKAGAVALFGAVVGAGSGPFMHFLAHLMK